MEITILSRGNLPDTVNGWGFGGQTERGYLKLSNGDEWQWGRWHYRHTGTSRKIRRWIKEEEGKSVERSYSGDPMRLIREFYREKGVTIL